MKVCYSYAKTTESVWWVNNDLPDRRIVFHFPAGARDFSLLHSRPTVGTAEPRIQWYRELFPQRKSPGAWNWPRVPIFFIEVKNSWSCAFTLPYSFVAWYLIKQADDVSLSLYYTTIGISFLSFHLLIFISVKWSSRWKGLAFILHVQ